MRPLVAGFSDFVHWGVLSSIPSYPEVGTLYLGFLSREGEEVKLALGSRLRDK